MLSDLESHPLLKTDGPEYSRRVLNETSVVQNPDPPVLDVVLAIEEVEQSAECFTAKVDGHGVDGEVAAIEIEFD